MTKKVGTQWKTSWKRDRKRGPLPPGGNMVFFGNFVSGVGTGLYRSAAMSALGQTLPFWFGAVGVQSANLSPQGFFGPSTGFRATVSGTLVPPVVSGTAFASPLVLNATKAASGSSFGGANFVVSAFIATVQTTSTGALLLTMYFCNSSTPSISTAAAYVPPGVSPLDLDASAGFLHGGVGGPGTPTAAQIAAWFQDLKRNVLIGPIPGMTTHLYSATSVFPAVPPVLPNGAGPQVLNFTVLAGAPAPTNTKIAVSFPW